MAGRKPSVRNKNGYWYSEAGGVGRYFGRCDEVPRAEAMAHLWTALASGEDTGGGEGEGDGRSTSAKSLAKELGERNNPRLGDGASSYFVRRVSSQRQTPNEGEPPPLSPLSSSVSPHEPTPTVQEFATGFLEWLDRNRAPSHAREIKRHLQRFCEAFGSTPITAINGGHLEAFTDALRAQGHALMYVKKHAVSVRALFAKAVRLGYLPKNPFVHVEGIRLDPKPLLESDLPTPEEVRNLFDNAKPDFHAMLIVYYNTGCRTHELIEARCGDFQAQSRTIVLGKHKRSRTLREPIPRTIHLNAEAYGVLQRRCQGKNPDEILFPNRASKPFTSVLLDDMFARLRKRASVRESITLYSFRHLWISEMLMAGHDSLLVARMAGISVKMIETVYGHFRVQSFADAQAKLDALRKRP